MSILTDFKTQEDAAQTAFLFDETRLPKQMAEAIVGAFGFNTSPDYQRAATSFLEDEGRVSVRTRAKAPVDTKALAELSNSEEFYVRPNGEKYYTRQWGNHSDVLVMRKAREVSSFVFLRSAPGTGKTALTEAAFGDKIFTLIGSGDTEAGDFLGSWIQMPDGSYAWHHGPLTRAMLEGGTFFIDEVGLIDPKVLSIVYPLMDGRRTLEIGANPSLGTIEAQPGFFIVSATNPKAPGVRLSEALLSRHLVHVEMTTDWALARKLGVPEDIVIVSKNLSKAVDTGELTWAPQFRELLGYRENAKHFGEAFAISNLLALAPESDRAAVADSFSRGTGSQVHPARIAN